VRESRLFDQFRDYLDTTCSDLKDAALVREKAARLEQQLKHTEEKAAVAAELPRAKVMEVPYLELLYSLYSLHSLIIQFLMLCLLSVTCLM